jgi:hypothetical protein
LESGSRDQFLDQTDDLLIFQFSDPADLFKDDTLLYRGNCIRSNLALYLQKSLLKIACGENNRVSVTSGTAGNGTYKQIRMPPVVDIIG